MQTIYTRLYETSNNCYFTVVISNLPNECYRVVLEGETVPASQRHLPWHEYPQTITINKFDIEEYTGTDPDALLAHAEARVIELGGDICKRRLAPARVTCSG
jgi:hypothetical protein